MSSHTADATMSHPEPGDIDADIQQLRRRLPTLEAVERRRSHLWLVGGFLLVVASATVIVLLFVPDAVEVVPDNDALRLGSALVSLAFLLYVFDQERRLRRLSRALVDERVLSSLLTERVRDLATLSRVGQVVNSVLTTSEVLQIILRGANELTRASTGSVMLLDEDELVVEASAGTDAAPRGARQPVDAGVAGEVAATREPLLISGKVTASQVRGRQPRRRAGGSAVIAPMLAGEQLVGVLALERAAEAGEFTQWDLRAVSLFANHAATAVNNARRYEAERHNVSRLADMIERRSEFVATLVHDLKSPLTSIVGFVDILRQPGLLSDADRDAALARVGSSSQVLIEMVEDVLRSASFESAAPVDPEPIRLAPFVADLVDATRSMALARDRVHREVRAQVPMELTLVTDPGALRSVLQNLLENAVKYSPPGAPVELRVRTTDDEVLFTVRDHGDGIADDEHEVIFERFRRRDHERAGDGVGLGLYIVRSLVAAQGGRIWVDSTPGNGSTFHVALPHRTGDRVPSG